MVARLLALALQSVAVVWLLALALQSARLREMVPGAWSSAIAAIVCPVAISIAACGAMPLWTRPRRLSWCGRAKARNGDAERVVVTRVRPPCSSQGSQSEVELAWLAAG